MNDAVQNLPVEASDSVVPFQVAPLDVRGRAVKLGPLLDTILDRHDYPASVNKLMAQAITLTVLLGTALKFDGKLILQTKTDGPVSMIVTEFRTPHSVRAYASFDREVVERAQREGHDATPQLLGKGILAMTIDQGKYSQRYQGIVQLDGTEFEEVAQQYFKQSEQIPTQVRLAVAETLTRSKNGKAKHGWTAGGVLMQFLPNTSERMRQKDLHGGDGAGDHEFNDDDVWTAARSLFSTISDLELTDGNLETERLLYRLFHEHGVRAFEATKVFDDCSCSQDTIRNVLKGFDEKEIANSSEEGEIKVTCEFCSKTYAFRLGEFVSEH